MGYNVPTGEPLMISLGGQPYIDVRLSFNSFLPQNLNSQISEKLVNAWIEKISIQPELHDKVEFEVALPNYLFDFKERINSLYPNLLNNLELNEIEKVYLSHLIGVVDENSSGSIQAAKSQIIKLEIGSPRIINS